MQAQLTTGEGLNRSLAITIPADQVAKKLEVRVNALTKTAKVDGFRPGKVPAKVIKQKMADQLATDVAQQLVQEYLPQALKEHNLNVAGQPRVHNNGPVDGFKVQEGADFNFTADVEIYPEFEPKGYTGLKLTREKAQPDDELINAALTRLQTQIQTFAEKKGKAEQGDRVTVTGQGFAKDEAFPGGNLQDFKIVLGSGQLIPGFEDALIGCKTGDEVDVKVTFPADYHAKELAGQPSVFKLKIDLIESPKSEELSDAAVKQFGFDSLDALKDVLKKGAERDIAQASEQRLKRQLLDALDAANSFDLPQGLVQAEHQALWQAQLQELRQRNMPIEALGGSVEEAIASLKKLAERRVRLGLTLAAIAKANKIEIKDEDLQKAINEQIAAAGPQQEQARAYFARPENRQQLLGPILEDKVTGWILEKAEITEKSISAKELLTELQ